MRSLARAFAVRPCDKYHNLMSWLSLIFFTFWITSELKKEDWPLVKRPVLYSPCRFYNWPFEGDGAGFVHTLYRIALGPLATRLFTVSVFSAYKSVSIVGLLFLDTIRRLQTLHGAFRTSSHLSSHSLNLGSRRGTTDDVATIPFHPSLQLPSGNLQTPFLSIRWCYLPISSSVFLSFLLISLSPAELSSPCQRILRCGHTIWVSVSLPWLGDNHALQLHSRFCCEPPRSSHGLCSICSEVSYSISSQGLDFCCHDPALTGIKEGA